MVDDEYTKKAFLLYTQSRMRRENIAKIANTTETETEETKHRESRLLKIKEMLFDLRKCEIYPMMSGYQEQRNWFGGK